MEERATLNEITTPAGLDTVFAQESSKHLVFLHDPWCPVSALALREVIQVDSKVSVIDVNHHEEVVLEFDRRLGINHESPHAFVIENGKAIWNVSHDAITAPAISLELGLEQ